MQNPVPRRRTNIPWGGAAGFGLLAARKGNLFRGGGRCRLGFAGRPFSRGLHCMWFLFLALVFVTGLINSFLQSAK